MGEYRILQPVVYAHDGIVTQHKKVGAFVELSEDVAAELGDAVQLIVRPAAEPETSAEPVANGQPAAVLDTPVNETTAAVTPEGDAEAKAGADPAPFVHLETSSADEPAKPRRGTRRGDDG